MKEAKVLGKPVKGSMWYSGGVTTEQPSVEITRIMQSALMEASVSGLCCQQLVNTEVAGKAWAVSPSSADRDRGAGGSHRPHLGAPTTQLLSLPVPGACGGLCMARKRMLGGRHLPQDLSVLTHIMPSEVPLTVTGLCESNRQGVQ